MPEQKGLTWWRNFSREDIFASSYKIWEEDFAAFVCRLMRGTHHKKSFHLFILFNQFKLFSEECVCAATVIIRHSLRYNKIFCPSKVFLRSLYRCGLCRSMFWKFWSVFPFKFFAIYCILVLVVQKSLGPKFEKRVFCSRLYLDL